MSDNSERCGNLPDSTCILSRMDPVTIALAQVLSSNSWETIKDLVKRGDQSAATAQVNEAIASIDATGVKKLDEQTKNDVRYKVLALAGLDDRPIVSAIMGMQSAEQAGQNLVRATWALVIASGALVLATVVLVIITAVKP
jgi:hypothetical protein